MRLWPLRRSMNRSPTISLHWHMHTHTYTSSLIYALKHTKLEIREIIISSGTVASSTFIRKALNSHFWVTFWSLTPFILIPLEACGRLRISDYWTFSLPLIAEAHQRKYSMSQSQRFWEGMSHMGRNVTLLDNICEPLDRSVIFYNAASVRFHRKKLCSRFFSTQIQFCSQKRQISVFSHLSGTYE